VEASQVKFPCLSLKIEKLILIFYGRNWDQSRISSDEAHYERVPRYAKQEVDVCLCTTS